jgi:hypothetical protein
MLQGCVRTDLLEIDCEKEDRARHEEKIVRQSSEIRINESESFTVTQVYPIENESKNNPCQIRRKKQVCFLGLGCSQE